MEPSEVWKPIGAYPEYDISSLGRVRNAKKTAKHEVDRIRVPDYNSRGYARLRLRRDGKVIRKFIHRLVAEAFLENPEGKELVDHINGDPSDNRLSNLRWSTRSENTLNGKVRKDKTLTTLRNIIKNGKWFRWRVCIRGQLHTSGNFATEQEAYADFLVKSKDLSNFVRLYPLPAVFSG